MDAAGTDSRGSNCFSRRHHSAMGPARVLLVSLLVLHALAVNVQAQQAGASQQRWIRIPLSKASRADDRRRMQEHQQQLFSDRLGAQDDAKTMRRLSSDDFRDARLVHQQQRVRRRLLHENGNSTSANDPVNNATVTKSMVYSEVPLGVGFGTHYAEIYLGVPAQRASVIVDTGSHLTALPCSSCKGCGEHTDAFFDITKSTTAKFATCREFSACNTCSEDRCYISQSYTEGSMWQAVVVDELVWVGGFSGTDADLIMHHYGVRFPLGCQTKETGLFITQKENGIMGMGRDKSTVLSYMVNAKRVEKNVFSLCFGANGGSLVLGGVDYTHHKTDVSYTPLIMDNSGWYPVKVKDIWVGGNTLGIKASELNSGKGVIVDSGTTDTFFVASGSRAFQREFERAAGVAYSENKMSVSDDDFKNLPNITIVLEGMKEGDEDIELNIPPQKYLTLSDDGKYYYGNIHFTERSGGVLGASTMVGYDVVFDVDSKRVGFAEANCDAASPANPAPANPGAAGTFAVASSNTNTQSNENPVDSLNYGTFLAQIMVISLVGLVLIAIVWRRMKARAWYAIPGDSTLGTPKEEDFNTDNDDVEEEEDDDHDHLPPNSTTSTTAVVRSPPRRKIPSPRFTIGSDDEEEARGYGDDDADADGEELKRKQIAERESDREAV